MRWPRQIVGAHTLPALFPYSERGGVIGPPDMLQRERKDSLHMIKDSSKGTGEKIAGTVQKKIGDIEKVFEK